MTDHIKQRQRLYALRPTYLQRVYLTCVCRNKASSGLTIEFHISRFSEFAIHSENKDCLFSGP